MVERFKYNCKSPVKVFDNKLGVEFNRPCLKCDNCRNQTSAKYTSLINVEMQKHKYNYFLTLTYNDYHLPTGELVCNIDKYRNNESFYEVIPNFKSYNSVGELIESYGFVKEFNTNSYEEYIAKVNHRINYEGKILLLNRYEVQKFLKRINISFKRFTSSNEPLRYFALLEYGAKFYRPHVHIILHTNNSRIEEYISERFQSINSRSQKYTSKLWKYGHIILERATTTGVSNYLSGYVSKTLCDISVLCTEKSCPKILHSSHYGDYFYFSNLVDFNELADMPVEDYSKKVVSTPYGFLRPSQSSYVNSYVCPSLPYSRWLDANDIFTFLNLRKYDYGTISEQSKVLTSHLLNSSNLSYTYDYLYKLIQNSYSKRLAKDDSYRYKKAQFFFGVIYRILSVSHRWLMLHVGSRSDVNKYCEYFHLNEMRQLRDFYRIQEIYYLDHEFNDNDLQFLYINGHFKSNDTTFQKQINDINYKKCVKHYNKKLHNNLNYEV